VLTYLQFISIKVKVPKFTRRHWCLCSPILFLQFQTSSHLQWLGHSVSATSGKQAAHRKPPFNVRLTCTRSKNLLSDEGQFVTNVHSVVPEVHRIRSIRNCELMIFHLQHLLGHLTAIGTWGTASSRVHVLWHLISGGAVHMYFYVFISTLWKSFVFSNNLRVRA